MRTTTVMSLAIALAWTGAGDAQQPDLAKDDAQKVVCKSERFVGSNRTRRICKTKEEWEFGKRHDKEWLDSNSGKLFAPPMDTTGVSIGPPPTPKGN